MIAASRKQGRYEAFIGRGLKDSRTARPWNSSRAVVRTRSVLRGGFSAWSLFELCGACLLRRTSLAFSLLAQATERQEACAFVDVSDSLDPVSLAAAGVNFLDCSGSMRRNRGPRAGPQDVFLLALAEQEMRKTGAQIRDKKPMPGHGWRHRAN